MLHRAESVPSTGEKDADGHDDEDEGGEEEEDAGRLAEALHPLPLLLVLSVSWVMLAKLYS